MSVYDRSGEAFLQFAQQLEQRLLLLVGAGVHGMLVVLAHATDIADADAVGIVPRAMGTILREGPALFDGAIKADDVVVADGGEAAAAMPCVYLCGCMEASLGGGAAVDDDFVDLAHGRGVLGIMFNG